MKSTALPGLCLKSEMFTGVKEVLSIILNTLFQIISLLNATNLSQGAELKALLLSTYLKGPFGRCEVWKPQLTAAQRNHLSLCLEKNGNNTNDEGLNPFNVQSVSSINQHVCTFHPRHSAYAKHVLHSYKDFRRVQQLCWHVRLSIFPVLYPQGLLIILIWTKSA